MTYVVVAPEMVAAAATDLANVGSTLSAANAAAPAPTMGVLAAGADEVSAAIAALFQAHGQAYHVLSAQAAAFQTKFEAALTAGANAYASAEAAAASPLQPLLDLVNAPTQALLGRPLIGNGANGVPRTGQDGARGQRRPVVRQRRCGRRWRARRRDHRRDQRCRRQWRQRWPPLLQRRSRRERWNGYL